jgi:RHS repeat-associated protein
VGFAFDPSEKRLTWAVPELGAGAVISGGFQARAQGVALGETIVNTVVATAAGLPTPVTAPAVVSVRLPAAARAWIGPAGGVLAALEGRVVLVFPADAVAEPVLVEITPAAEVRLEPQLIEAFRLTAQDQAGQPVTQFGRPVQVLLDLELYDAALRTRQGSPSLYWLDEGRGEWQAVPTAVDWGRNTATATVEHFSIYAAGTSSTLSYGAQHLPTVHGFTNDEWSGNSSVTYPLELPPGPGGFGLNLSLSYSSEGVNSIRQGPSSEDEQKAKTFSRQAGFVGWGWSLAGLGQITVKLPQAQKYYLEFAGGSFELKWTANGWQTEPQSFVRIEHSQDGLFDNNPWYVWAPDGTRYTFGSPGGWGANGQHWVRNTGSCGRHMLAMHLTEVRDTHGNRAVVTYATETKDITCADGSAQPYVRAIRPTRLEYLAVGEPLATVRVDFAYASRSDTGVPGKDYPDVEAFWSDYRLSTITVKVRNGTAADAFATVRSYSLTQDYLWKDQAGGQGLLRLTGITEQGKDGGALPAWTFAYVTLPGSDWLNYTLLATADNGQGGRVTYSYADVANIWMEGCGGNTKRFRVSQMETRDGLGTAAHNSNAAYDALGRLDLILLGNGQQTDYVYYSHTQKGGRLYQLKTGTAGAPTATQYLEYDYDNVGNVASLKDYNNVSQVQSFSYDALDRLTLASTNAAGTDQYSESYGYNAIGNLTSKGGSSYSYDSAKKHAVRRVNGSGGSSQTVTIRAKGVYSGGWPQMKLRINGTDRQTWTVSSSTYTNYSVSTTLTGRDVIEVVYTNDSGARSLYVDYVTVNGSTVQAEGGAMVYDRGTGNAAFDDLDVIAGQELLDVNGALRFVKGAGAYAAGYDANGNMTVRVVEGKAYLQTWDAENRLVTLTQGGTVTSFTYDGDGKRVKATVDVTTAYVGNWYEWTGSGTSYYHFAGRRVAMRTASGVSYIYGDHLGSATNTTGSQVSSQRYYPYGARRGSNTVVTPYRFTSQREESTIGLYYYGARYYDAALGRFIQADTIVPEPGNPQALNRYSYVLNNALRYTDPTGMFSEDEIMKYLDVDSWEGVLAKFGEGGEFAGRWGVLQLLRQAHLGDTVWIYQDAKAGEADSGFGYFLDLKKLAGGILRERDGRLTLEGRGLWDIASFGKMGDVYFHNACLMCGGPMSAYEKKNLPRVQRNIDWVGVGFDLGGVAADAVSFGAAGRVVNAVQVANNARKVGQALDVAGVVYTLGVGASEWHQTGGISGETGRSMVYSGAGFFPGLGTISDAVSALDGIFYWGP